MVEDFVTKLSDLMKKYGRKPEDVENVKKSLKALKANIKFKKLDGPAQDQMALDSCELAFKEGLEIENAFALIDLAELSKKDINELVPKLKETLEKEQYKDITPKFRKEELAIKGMRAGIAYDIRVKTKKFNLVLLGKSSPREVGKKDGSKNINATIGAYVKPLEDDGIEPFYRALTFWGEHSKKVKDLIIGHLYEVNLTRNAQSERTDAWIPADKTEFVDKGRYTGDPLIDIENAKNIKKIKLVEAEFNITKGYDEYVRVDCSILSRQIFQAKGKDIGKLLVDDGTIDDMVFGGDGEDNPVGGFTIFSDPQNLTQGEGSEVSIIGRISKAKNDLISLNGDTIIPIYSVPIEVVPMNKETDAPMKSGDENVIDPGKLSDDDNSIVPDDLQGLNV